VPDASANRLVAVLDERFDELLRTWISDQLATLGRGQIAENDLRAQCTELLQMIRRTLVVGAPLDLEAHARAMDGDLTVESREGEGSTLVLRLPRAG
jgi:hypothetical protein